MMELDAEDLIRTAFERGYAIDIWFGKMRDEKGFSVTLSTESHLGTFIRFHAREPYLVDAVRKALRHAELGMEIVKI